ncbi:MAG: hypothetical protein IT440_00085 [Phycisphaeraceae bacterium]|nr:hypothetical protein [Phycisphaeraceae bacterium]
MVRASHESRWTFFDAIPGWLLVLCGAAIFGACLLIPPWKQSKALAWQLDVMRVQAGQIGKELKDYQALERAVEQDDPLLLQRLAFEQLRQKPQGVELMAPPAPLLPVGIVLPTDDQKGWSLRYQPSEAGQMLCQPKPVEAMVEHPVPVPGVNCVPPVEVQSTLIRLTTGPLRPVVAALGLVCLSLGLVLSPTRKSRVAG